jgi:hypothetical protein
MHFRSLALALVLAAAPAAFGQFAGSENFASALGSNWEAVSYTDVGTVTRSLAQGGGRLDWTASIESATGSRSSNALLEWQGNLGSYTADWSVTLSVMNAYTPSSSGTASESVGLGLRLWNTADAANHVKLVLHQANFGGATNIFHSFFSGPGGQFGIGNSTEGIGTSGVVGISFNSATKVFSTLYDQGGGWVQIGSFGIDGSGGTNGNADWDMTNGSTFTVGILGIAEIYENNASLSLPFGTAFADNFALSDSALTAVPEPSTYASVAAAIALAFAWLARRRHIGVCGTMVVTAD